MLVAALSQMGNCMVVYSPLVLEFFDGFVVDADCFAKLNVLCTDRNCCLVLSSSGWIVLCGGADGGFLSVELGFDMVNECRFSTPLVCRMPALDFTSG